MVNSNDQGTAANFVLEPLLEDIRDKRLLLLTRNRRSTTRTSQSINPLAKNSSRRLMKMASLWNHFGAWIGQGLSHFR